MSVWSVLWFLFKLYLAFPWCVLIVLRNRLQVHLALTIKHNFSYLLIQLVKRVAQSLLQLIGDEVTVVGPPLETLGNQIVCEPFELAITVFHLVVLCVEDHRLLDLLYVSLVQNVFPDRQLFQAEISFKCITDLVASMFSNSTVEDFKFHQGHVVA